MCGGKTTILAVVGVDSLKMFIAFPAESGSEGKVVFSPNQVQMFTLCVVVAFSCGDDFPSCLHYELLKNEASHILQWPHGFRTLPSGKYLLIGQQLHR